MKIYLKQFEKNKALSLSVYLSHEVQVGPDRVGLSAVEQKIEALPPDARRHLQVWWPRRFAQRRILLLPTRTKREVKRRITYEILAWARGNPDDFYVVTWKHRAPWRQGMRISLYLIRKALLAGFLNLVQTKQVRSIAIGLWRGQETAAPRCADGHFPPWFELFPSHSPYRLWGTLLFLFCMVSGIGWWAAGWQRGPGAISPAVSPEAQLVEQILLPGPIWWYRLAIDQRTETFLFAGLVTEGNVSRWQQHLDHLGTLRSLQQEPLLGNKKRMDGRWMEGEVQYGEGDGSVSLAALSERRTQLMQCLALGPSEDGMLEETHTLLLLGSHDLLSQHLQALTTCCLDAWLRLRAERHDVAGDVWELTILY